jgi:hypothetical protein
MTPEMTRITMAVPDPAKPWYRDRWPWLLIAGPAIVVVAGFATAWLAWSTDDGVVADDYYKRGLVINKQLERSGRGEALGLGAVLDVGPDGDMVLALSGSVADAATPATVRVRLTNATRAGLDRTATLARGIDGSYTGRIDPPPSGRWLVSVETDGWRLPTVEVAGAVRAVRLGTARAVD